MDRQVHPLWAEIDLSAFERNFREVIRLAGPQIKIIGSIKADAYGHGAVKIAELLSRHNVYSLMTGSFEEAKQIRDAGIKTPIAMFGFCTPESISAVLHYDLIPTIYNRASADAVSRAARKQTSVYIKIDSGLGRLGTSLESAADFVAYVAGLPLLRVECVYTHVPFVTAAGRDWARERLAEFASCLAHIRDRGITIPITQARASSALLAGLGDSCNAVCVGHLLYGLVPVLPEVSEGAGFQPILSAIKTQLIHVAHHATGELNKNASYAIRNARTTGVVPIGTSRGMRSVQQNSTLQMLIRGIRVPIIGVSLEHTTLDISQLEDPEVGTEVTIIGESQGKHIGLLDLAQSLDCSALEVLMGFSGRMERQYSGTSGI